MAEVNIRTIQFLLHNQYFNDFSFISFHQFISNSLNIPNPIPHPHPNIASFGFLFTSVLELLQLKYQGKQLTPFDTHPFETFAGIVCLLLYCLGYYVQLTFSSNLRYRIRLRKYVCWITIFSASVCLASMVSILFPDWIRPILFLMVLVIAAAELLHSLYCGIVHRITEFSHRRSRRSPVRRPILPL